MWMFGRSLKVMEVAVMYDDENHRVMVYTEIGKDGAADSYWFTPDDGQYFFDTEKDAIRARDAKWENIVRTVPVVKQFLHNIYSIRVWNENLREKVRNLDFGKKYVETEEPDDDSKYQDARDLNDLYRTYIRTGMLLIDSVSFRREDVRLVEWLVKDDPSIRSEEDKRFARLHMSDERKVETSTRSEYDFVDTLFGPVEYYL